MKKELHCTIKREEDFSMNMDKKAKELGIDGKCLPEGFFGNAQCLIRNYPDTAPGNRLLPYETFVLSGRAM